MNVTRVLGLAAVGALLILAAPTAEALSLANPGAAAAVQETSKQGSVTEVRWHHRWHRRWHRR
jgi:hypothetical protein